MNKNKLCLRKKNYIIIAIAAVMILAGFSLTCGSPSTPEAFNPDVFSFRRVVIGPNISFVGYIIMIYGIMAK